jgi:hypothetical protein
VLLSHARASGGFDANDHMSASVFDSQISKSFQQEGVRFSRQAQMVQDLDLGTNHAPLVVRI